MHFFNVFCNISIFRASGDWYIFFDYSLNLIKSKSKLYSKLIICKEVKIQMSRNNSQDEQMPLDFGSVPFD